MPTNTIAVVIVESIHYYRLTNDCPEVAPQFGYVYHTMTAPNTTLGDPSQLNNGLDKYGHQFFTGEFTLDSLSKGTVYGGSSGSSTLLHVENGGLSFMNKEFAGLKVSFFIPRLYFKKVCIYIYRYFDVT